MDLNKIVTASLEEVMSSGYIEDLVKKEIQKTVSCIVQDTFRSYSDFGKKLEAKIREELKINLDALKLPEYNQMLLDEIQKTVDLEIRHGGLDAINELITRLLSDTKAEYDLSDIIEEFIENVRRNSDLDDMDDEEITLYIDEDDSSYTYSKYTHIYMDKEPKRSKYSCDVQINLSNGVPYSIKLKGENIQPKCILGGLSSFEALLFKIYSSGAKVKLDKGSNPECYDLYIIEEEEDDCEDCY